MKVLYDHQIFSSQVFGGISRYFMELFKQFDIIDQVEYDLRAKWSNNFYLQQSDNFSPNNFLNGIDFRGKNRLLERINRYNTVQALKQGEYDLFHPTFYNPYFFKYLDNKPFILTVHDLIHEIYPQLPNADKEISNRKQLINKAAMIITPSINTKNDLLNFYDITEDKVEVIYHGYFKTSEKDTPNVQLPEKYFLFVGSRVFYKNFSLILKAMSQINKKYSNIHLICAGGGSFSKTEKSLISNLDLTSNILQYNFSDTELNMAYNKAIAFVFPSLYEGFGIPILEAFSNDCPCILADASCLPEVAEDAALYFEPKSIKDLSMKMFELFLNKDLRKSLIKKGQYRLNNFSWEKTSVETINIYKKILA